MQRQFWSEALQCKVYLILLGELRRGEPAAETRCLDSNPLQTTRTAANLLPELRSL